MEYAGPFWSKFVKNINIEKTKTNSPQQSDTFHQLSEYSDPQSAVSSKIENLKHNDTVSKIKQIARAASARTAGLFGSARKQSNTSGSSVLDSDVIDKEGQSASSRNKTSTHAGPDTNRSIPDTSRRVSSSGSFVIAFPAVDVTKDITNSDSIAHEHLSVRDAGSDSAIKRQIQMANFGAALESEKFGSRQRSPGQRSISQRSSLPLISQQHTRNASSNIHNILNTDNRKDTTSKNADNNSASAGNDAEFAEQKVSLQDQNITSSSSRQHSTSMNQRQDYNGSLTNLESRRSSLKRILPFDTINDDSMPRKRQYVMDADPNGVKPDLRLPSRFLVTKKKYPSATSLMNSDEKEDQISTDAKIRIVQEQQWQQWLQFQSQYPMSASELRQQNGMRPFGIFDSADARDAFRSLIKRELVQDLRVRSHSNGKNWNQTFNPNASTDNMAITSKLNYVAPAEEDDGSETEIENESTDYVSIENNVSEIGHRTTTNLSSRQQQENERELEQEQQAIPSQTHRRTRSNDSPKSKDIFSGNEHSNSRVSPRQTLRRSRRRTRSSDKNLKEEYLRQEPVPEREKEQVLDQETDQKTEQVLSPRRIRNKRPREERNAQSNERLVEQLREQSTEESSEQFGKKSTEWSVERPSEQIVDQGRSTYKPPPVKKVRSSKMRRGPNYYHGFDLLLEPFLARLTSGGSNSSESASITSHRSQSAHIKRKGKRRAAASARERMTRHWMLRKQQQQQKPFEKEETVEQSLSHGSELDVQLTPMSEPASSQAESETDREQSVETELSELTEQQLAEQMQLVNETADERQQRLNELQGSGNSLAQSLFSASERIFAALAGTSESQRSSKKQRHGQHRLNRDSDVRATYPNNNRENYRPLLTALDDNSEYQETLHSSLEYLEHCKQQYMALLRNAPRRPRTRRRTAKSSNGGGNQLDTTNTPSIQDSDSVDSIITVDH